MKQILFILFFSALSPFAMSQSGDDFDKLWKKVNDLEEKGLTASAHQEVISIHQLAVDRNIPAQQIKSAMYIMKYRSVLEEESELKNLLYLDTLIQISNGVSRNIFYSIRGEFFHQYFQVNRYRFYERTNTLTYDTNNLKTWSAQQVLQAADASYQLSLKDKASLQSVNIEQFKDILVEGNSRQLRPTLFDLLAHRALAFYTTTHDDIVQPVDVFTLNNEMLMAPAPVFMHQSFETPDTAATHYRAIQLFQSLLKFHQNENLSAFLDVDLIRLHFIREHATFNSKDSLYLEALRNIELKNTHPEVVSTAIYLQAAFFYNRKDQYNASTTPELKDDLIKAAQLAQTVLNRFPNTASAKTAQNLMTMLNTPTLAYETELVQIPNKPFLSLVKYANVTKVYFRLAKITKTEIDQINKLGYQKKKVAIASLKSFRNWNETLPNPGDYRMHSAEFKTDGLPVGTYILIAQLNEEHSIEKNIIAHKVIHVSNISYISNNSKEYYVLDRTTGYPKVGATVKVMQSSYNSQTKTNEEILLKEIKTDLNGKFSIKDIPIKNRNYFNFDISHQNDRIHLFNNNEYIYNSEYIGKSNEEEKLFLFTDRSLYRPGQTVFFKGIALIKDDQSEKTKVRKNLTTVIELHDANDETIQSGTFTTNEFGSFTGSFVIPETGLTGSFNLYDTLTGNYIDFSVEEYKRPKFKTTIDKPTGSYHLNDTISIKGNALAYAGNSISNAKVTYTVKRKTNFPIWRNFGYGRRVAPGYSNSERIITTGITQTSADGSFTIHFKAFPDEKVDSLLQPTFNYDVHVDITDINGETRSATTNVVVGYHAIQLIPSRIDKINTNQLNTLTVKSENLNDIYLPALLNVKVEQMNAPKKVFRSRLWDSPDQFIIPKETYEKLFPHDEYGEENNPETWTVQSIAMQFSDSTKETGKIQWPNKTLTQGWYRITYTTISTGKQIQAIQWVQITGNNTIKEPVQFITEKHNLVQPNDVIQYSIKTGWDNVWMIHTLDRMQDRTETKYHAIAASKPFSQNLKVEEADRGGLTVNYIFIKNNRVYTGGKDYYIDWDNKNLQVNFKTFRNNTLPGNEETFTVEIKGHQKDVVMAEALISMYDASLDQFKPHNWEEVDNIWPLLSKRTYWTPKGFDKINAEVFMMYTSKYLTIKPTQYDQLISFYHNLNYGGVVAMDISKQRSQNGFIDLAESDQEGEDGKVKRSEYTGAATKISYKTISNNQNEIETSTNKTPPFSGKIRTDFRETAFFFPHLVSDKDGIISFTFTTPESLTQWRMMVLAHTPTLENGYAEKMMTTSLPLMAQMNALRFFRENDKLELPVKISNTSDTAFTGTVQLELIDASTDMAVDGWFQNVFPSQYFTVDANQSNVVHFPIQIPVNFNSALKIRIKAITQNGLYSDGEENVYPVVINRTLVTEALPFTIRNTNEVALNFQQLKNSGSSSSLKHHSLTVEYTSNPVWYAVQALPYLMEYPYECSEQIFSRFYANSLASLVANSTPKIRQVFELWNSFDSSALQSNLMKNSSLKTALLEETPWVLDAKNENQQKKNIALLFNLNKLANEKDKTLQKLSALQNENGSFSWFANGPDNAWITQHIIIGLGRLIQLNAIDKKDEATQNIIKKALQYLDSELVKEYKKATVNKKTTSQNNLSPFIIHHLYMRTLFTDRSMNPYVKQAITYYLNQEKRFWNKESLYMKAMMAIALNKTDKKTALAILRSMKENAIYNKELGMYWKELESRGYYWYQAPVETVSMIITAFREVSPNDASNQELTIWLLKNKQTTHWKTTKATTDACYALLLNNAQLQEEPAPVNITLGNQVVQSDPQTAEAGSGYFKMQWKEKDIQPSMGDIKINRINTNPTNISWGGIYWQYFEDLDKIKSTYASPLSIQRSYFVEHPTNSGPVLKSIENESTITVGSKIVVRVVIKTDRDMEYIHLKDMRVSGMEPVNVLSGYKYSHGLGYYESTKDLASHFFIDYLPKGTYVFEYSLFATHAGQFSSGISSIQSMYAPEFTSHSEGIRINIEEME